MDKRLFRKLTGKNLDDFRLPTLSDINRRLDAELLTHRPLRELGHTQDGQSFITEEDRESHIHILGSPGEGKSKFLEHLIRQDIDRGYGACLLDPSDNGDTAYKILKYCAKIGFEKVCLIDPHHRYGAFSVVPCINPISNAPPEVTAEKMMDTSRILWKTKDFAENAIIETYFPAVIYAIANAEMTMHEFRHFLTYQGNRARNEILDQLHPLDDSRQILDEVFSDKGLYKSEYRSTMRRMIPFMQKTIKLMFGGKQSINFGKMITDGWLILLNLDAEGIYGQKHQRLLGTVIVNEIIYAIHRLRENGWKGVYYLYIDEVGDYATPKLAEILLKKRKTGLRLTLAHQAFHQISDAQVLNAIYTGTKTKILFNTKNPDDQKKMIAMMYGGDLNSEQTRYALMQLKKQHAIIKVDKGDPAVTRIPDIPDIKIEQKVLNDFISKLYRKEWYHHPKAVLEEINARFKAPESVSGATIKKSNVKRSETTNPRSAGGIALFDDKADSKTVLRRPKGRKASEDIPT